MAEYRYNQKVRMVTYLTKTEEAAIQAAALKLGMSCGQFLRDLALAYVEQNKGGETT